MKRVLDYTGKCLEKLPSYFLSKAQDTVSTGRNYANRNDYNKFIMILSDGLGITSLL